MQSRREFLLKVLNAPNIVTGDNRMSRAAAFVFAFSFIHSLPNALLLLPRGAERYDNSVKDAHKLKLLPIFEVYLAISFIAHASLAVNSGIKGRRVLLLITGAIISGFLFKHIRDFRLGDFRESTPSQQLDKVLNKKPDEVLYLLGVAAVAVHTYRGVNAAWLFRLGFRGEEIPHLIFLGRCMTALSTCLYTAPILLH